MEGRAIFLEYFTNKREVKKHRNYTESNENFQQIYRTVKPACNTGDQQGIGNAPDNFSEGFSYLRSEQTA